MTVASSAISSACNITLITDYVRVDDFKHKGLPSSASAIGPSGSHIVCAGSGLTPKQRSLVIACMALLCYLALGSICFSFLDSPHLNFQARRPFALTVTTR